MLTEYFIADVEPDSVSHFVMLITAGPMRDSFRSGFISRDVFQLAHESQPTTRASAGYIFEDSMHRILKKGACLQLRKMRDSGTGKKNTIYTTGKNDFPQ
ncbi:hypothetical protein K435DRAFT_849763 [Dendrothele bispora CBS 962.96]|uniref:Uncharacterized protein n=1 Tax=Dendrothele bispora (strain CBS 962.96) TaxID=1314807 RepID=A0A4V4HI93_DENBC|nr:hypothetical protein K435DRAFT_849763 [Dendrothele bispora CBS 962.96]